MLLCDYLQICCDRKVVPSLTWLNKSRRSLRRPWARHLLSASCSRDSVTDRSIHRWTRRLQEARTTPSVLPCLKNAVNVSCWLITRALSTQRIYPPHIHVVPFNLLHPWPSSILCLPLHPAVDVLGIFQVWMSRAYSHLPILRNSQPVSERNNNWQVGQNFRDPVVTDWFLN